MKNIFALILSVLLASTAFAEPVQYRDQNIATRVCGSIYDATTAKKIAAAVTGIDCEYAQEIDGTSESAFTDLATAEVVVGSVGQFCALVTAGEININGELRIHCTATNANAADWAVALSTRVHRANLTQVDGVANVSATLNLTKLNIVNSGGDAIVASSTGSNGNGINASGNGSGAGQKNTGGATGAGQNNVGGSTSGAGTVSTGTAGNANGVTFTGQGSGHGLQTTGGSTGRGVYALGGSTSGAGIYALGQGATAEGIHGDASGGSGIRGSASTGNGLRAGASSSGGVGLLVAGSGTGNGATISGGATGQGVQINGGSTSGIGLEVVATSGDGIRSTSNGGNGRGAYFIGNGTSAGVRAVGGATGPGATFVGGSTSGAAISATNTTGNVVTVIASAGNGNAVALTPHGTGVGLSATLSGPLVALGADSVNASALATDAVNEIAAAVTTGAADGTLQAVSSNTATLAAAENYASNSLNDQNSVEIISATTGVGQTRCIKSSSGDIMTLTAAWQTTPTGTITYRVNPTPNCNPAKWPRHN